MNAAFLMMSSACGVGADAAAPALAPAPVPVVAAAGCSSGGCAAAAAPCAAPAATCDPCAKSPGLFGKLKAKFATKSCEPCGTPLFHKAESCDTSAKPGLFSKLFSRKTEEACDTCTAAAPTCHKSLFGGCEGAGLFAKLKARFTPSKDCGCVPACNECSSAPAAVTTGCSLPPAPAAAVPTTPPDAPKAMPAPAPEKIPEKKPEVPKKLSSADAPPAVTPTSGSNGIVIPAAPVAPTLNSGNSPF